jgi:predicted PurR-regulated permease PerM
VLSAPLHGAIERRLGRPALAAFLSVLLVAVLVALPLAFVVERLVAEAVTGVAALQDMVKGGAVERLLAAHPTVAPIGEWLAREVDLPAVLGALAGWLSGAGASFLRGSILGVTEVVLAFYFLFYFLRDSGRARQALHDWLPLSHAEGEQLGRRVVDTIHATVYGTIAVAAIQGALGGLMFWFLGLPTALLWGLVMALLSVVPVLGAFVVWLPAAILLALGGDWISAAILAAWGALVVGSIDNILRPIFVGNRLQLHTVPAFIAMVGGLLWFGAAGFILGPLAVTITLLLIEIARARRHAGDSAPPPGPGDPLDRTGAPV